MNQLEREVKVTYRWWREDDINPVHVERLEEHAMTRIIEMLHKGFTSGELLCEEDDMEYSGWWEMNTKNTTEEK